MLTALDHVVIAVADLEQATATHARLFGRSPSWRGAHPGMGTANTIFRLDNTYVELLAATTDGPLAQALRAHIAEAGAGLFALAFGTTDADACATAWNEKGLQASRAVAGEGLDAETGARRQWRSVFAARETTRGVPLFAIEHRSPAAALPAAPATAEAGTTVDGIDHVVIMTADAEAARALYGDGLGLRLALDRAFPERGLRLLFFRVGGLTIELAARVTPAGSAPEPFTPDRLFGISYRVGDVTAAQQRLRAEGFDVSEVRRGMKPGTRVCTVHRETHGVATLLIGPEPA